MFALWAAAPSSTESAIANGDTRTIHFYHTHTGESIDATFRVDGHYDPAVLKQLNHFLRDWRNNDETNMDPRLFDTLWEVYRMAEAGDTPIQIFSSYRSPETNAMLRRRSRAVAEHSQHMLGKAMDTTMPGMSMEKIREIGMKLQRGGVGYYQSSNFVHLDVGGVRSWPRMSYDQLSRLFPDGKTVHIPANGQPLARYEEARAEIAARGVEVPPSQESQGFFAWLFGGGNNGGGNAASAPRAPSAMAYANNTEGDEANERGPAAARRALPPAAQAVPVAQARPEQVVVPVPESKPFAVASAAGPEVDRAIPLPPRRPLALMASLGEELPLPPARAGNPGGFHLASIDDDPVPVPASRPVAFADPAAALNPSPAAQPNGPRTRALPEIITQGTASRALPAPVLAFAAPEPVPGAKPSESGRVGGPSATPKALGLRGMVNQRNETSIARKSGPATPALADAAPVLMGPAIIGLRRAALGPATAASL